MKITNLGQIQECMQKTKQNTETDIAKLAELTTEAVEEVQAQLDAIAQLTALLEAQKEQLNTIHTNTARLTNTRAGYIDKLANLGATGDTGGSATAGTITAKLNKLLIDLTTTRAGYLDKLANFGTPGETGGSATTGTMMAKLNKLLGDWTTTRAGYINTINTNTARLTATRASYIDKLGTGVGIKSVQRGTFQETPTSSDNENSITVTLTTVNPAKTFILLHGGLSAGYSGSSSAVRGYISSVSATNFVYKTGRASITLTGGFVSWQAVEFY